MTLFGTHYSQLFILFLTPVIGLYLDLLLGKKRTFYILGIVLFLLVPILFGYNYTEIAITKFLGLMSLGCLYSFISNQIKTRGTKIFLSISFTIVLLIFLGYYSFLDTMSGSQKVDKTWKINKYKIEHIIDQGFAGRPAMNYEISKYSIIPILIKKLDISGVVDSLNKCIVHFKNVKIDFNECEKTLRELKQQSLPQ
jgi:hypothetical protein